MRMNLQFFGGRGSGGTNAKANAVATAARETANIGSEANIDKASFSKSLSGVYIASVGSMKRNYTNESSPAAQMAIVPHRENGKTFYTTRYIVYGGNRDWQDSSTQYSSLNAAKKGVKNSLKDYINEEIRRR